jgi:hypothetical protein
MNAEQLKPGDEVYWNDPDEGISSGYYTVKEVLSESGDIEDDTIVIIKNDAGTWAEVFVHEIS